MTKRPPTKISPFAQRCYQWVAQIPKGRVTTYKALAQAMGTRGYQAIGRALNANPNLVTVPCHRVIHQDGRLGGYAAGVEHKRRLLESEGVQVEQDRIDLNRFGWDFIAATRSKKHALSILDPVANVPEDKEDAL